MKRTGIFYGTSTGNTREVAEMIASRLGVKDSDVHDVASVAPSELGNYDVIILGSPTYGSGELQDDWYDFITGAEQLDLKGKTVAVFGCGDENMSDTFCDAVGIIYDRMGKTGARFTGEYNAACYHYGETGAEIDGKIIGLLIDNVNHADITAERVNGWCDQLKNEL